MLKKNIYNTRHYILTISKYIHKKNYLIHKYLVPLIIKTSKKILTVSNFSQKEIASTYKCDYKKIEIIYNAVTYNFQHTQTNKPKDQPYFLSVSSVKENKNFLRVVESFKKFQNKYPESKLFIIGDLKTKAFKDVNINLNEPNIVFTGRVTEHELINYYSNALCFIFPSLYEGFGIPIIEAQACKTPVITSNTSSLPEIAGNSVLYCNPYSIDDICEKMELIYSQRNLREELIVKGSNNIKRFSWEKSGYKLIDIIDKLND